MGRSAHGLTGDTKELDEQSGLGIYDRYADYSYDQASPEHTRRAVISARDQTAMVHACLCMTE